MSKASWIPSTEEIYNINAITYVSKKIFLAITHRPSCIAVSAIRVEAVAIWLGEIMLNIKLKVPSVDGLLTLQVSICTYNFIHVLITLDKAEFQFY